VSADENLANLAAYDLWAQTYPPVPHNALMRAEQHAMLALWPELSGRRALDLACGTGRYAQLLERSGADPVVATDLSPGMLALSNVSRRVRADMMQLPFADESFDFVVSGLAVGHAPHLDLWTREMARVLAPGGVLLYSDFHPEAARVGMTRSFTDAQHCKHTLLHRNYDLPAHRAANAAAGLQLDTVRELRVGEDLQEAFSGSDVFYRRWTGLPVVLVLRASKADHHANA
jgi:malonyl-CoA O-methyltransferase